MDSRIAIIPARGGSKRMPRKNILPLCGKPLLVWSIEAAFESCLFEKVCVSTEDDEIASIASDSGALVLKRPASLATDQSTVAQTCLYHLRELHREGSIYDFLYCLYPTSPLRNATDLSAIAKVFRDNPDAQSVIAATDYSHYPFQALVCEKNCKVAPFWPELVRKRSSDLPDLVAGNGSTYAITVPAFLQSQDFYTSVGMYVHRMEKLRSIDVDTADDFALLEACMAIALKNKVA